MTSKPTVAPMLFRLQDIADAVQLSKRTINRLRASGALPAADFAAGSKSPRWFQKTIDAWLSEGGNIALLASSRKSQDSASN